MDFITGKKMRAIGDFGSKQTLIKAKSVLRK